MENNEQRGNVYLGIVSGLMALFLVGSIYFWQRNQTLTRQNNDAEQRADSLLAVKIRLEGDIRTLQNQIETSTGEKASLDKRLTDLQGLIVSRDRIVRELRQGNLGRTRTIRDLNHNIAGLQTVRDSLENQMVAVNDKISWLTDSNSLLTSQNKELQQNVTALNATLLTMVPRSAVTADAFRVEAEKRNKKETAKAKKVHTLLVSLNVPGELDLNGMQEVYLSLKDENQNNMMPPLRTTTISLADVNEIIPVHAVQNVNFGRSPQRITFSITPSDDIKPGLYRAFVFTKDAYLGSVEFQFRDSFWFF
ncbi:hypothetical protein HNV11_20205 [Spirosoma taeanense]|uniref:Uncharacterized protein n=1 Tax=Spirosoma taeanense TaxID=2735870 RepID=A0A6M5YBX4_9BACT|nr:hypothetical protein [Spirosoma taeanense]QJW91535.1 hypothetical protein HNV11_20205 [Spirosoma taeanense]